MKGYWIVKVNDLHLDKQKIYKELATETVKKFNGRFLVRGGKILLWKAENLREMS